MSSGERRGVARAQLSRDPEGDPQFLKSGRQPTHPVYHPSEPPVNRSVTPRSCIMFLSCSCLLPNARGPKKFPTHPMRIQELWVASPAIPKLSVLASKLSPYVFSTIPVPYPAYPDPTPSFRFLKLPGQPSARLLRRHSASNDERVP
jgi:hypothetical protein